MATVYPVLRYDDLQPAGVRYPERYEGLRAEATRRRPHRRELLPGYREPIDLGGRPSPRASPTRGIRQVARRETGGCEALCADTSRSDPEVPAKRVSAMRML